MKIVIPKMPLQVAVELLTVVELGVDVDAVGQDSYSSADDEFVIYIFKRRKSSGQLP